MRGDSGLRLAVVRTLPLCHQIQTPTESHSRRYILIRGSVPGPFPFFRFIIRAVDENSEACVITGIGARFVGALGRIVKGIGYLKAMGILSVGRKVKTFIVDSMQQVLDNS